MSPEFRTAISVTLANKEWWEKNLDTIREKIIPATWTHIANLNGMAMGFQMKLLGIDWRDQNEFGRVMVFFEKIRLMQRNNLMQVRHDPTWVFDPAMFDDLKKEAK